MNDVLRSEKGIRMDKGLAVLAMACSAYTAIALSITTGNLTQMAQGNLLVLGAIIAAPASFLYYGLIWRYQRTAAHSNQGLPLPLQLLGVSIAVINLVLAGLIWWVILYTSFILESCFPPKVDPLIQWIAPAATVAAVLIVRSLRYKQIAPATQTPESTT